VKFNFAPCCTHAKCSFRVLLHTKKIETPKEGFTKIRSQVASAGGRLECLIVLWWV
jgi:hypothetical protein